MVGPCTTLKQPVQSLGREILWSVRFGGNLDDIFAPQGLENAAWFNDNGDDMAFLDAIIKRLDYWYCINTAQRFVVGFTYGGAMACAVANARPSQFRAVAVLSGTDLTPWAPDTTPLPISFFVAQGVRDASNLILKGRQMRDHFVQINGCANETALEPAPGSASHLKTTYRNCISGHPVTYIAFDGVHQYSPVDAGATMSWLLRETWNFSSRPHHLFKLEC